MRKAIALASRAADGPAEDVTTVLRIVANVAADATDEVARFYTDVFGLDVMMDLGWIVTLGSGERALTQMSLMREGGSGTVVPEISIEVDDVDATYAKARDLGCDIRYDLTDETWGVRRFFVADPTGKMLNVLAHR